MLNIESIKQGIVIDHIKPGFGFQIFKYLKLDEVDYPVALIMNANSKKHTQKDIIKIQSVLDIDFTMLGFIDPNITINVIRDEKVSEKISLSLPEKISGVIECKNPRCITSEEKEITHVFELVNEEKGIYKCSYCNQLYSWEG